MHMSFFNISMYHAISESHLQAHTHTQSEKQKSIHCLSQIQILMGVLKFYLTAQSLEHFLKSTITLCIYTIIYVLYYQSTAYLP